MLTANFLVSIDRLMLFLFCLLQLQGVKKTLILQEIPEDGVKKLLSNKESLAACDVAVFVYDRSRCCGTMMLAIYHCFSKAYNHAT